MRQLPEPRLRNWKTSPPVTVMFALFGRAIAAELVRTEPDETKMTSRLMPAGVVPKLVMVAVPVTATYSASDEPRSVVEAAAMEAEERAFVERTMDDRARRKSSRLLPMASEP